MCRCADEHDTARNERDTALQIGDLIDEAWAKLIRAQQLAADLGDETAWRQIVAASDVLATIDGVSGEDDRPVRHRQLLEARRRWIDKMPSGARL